MNTTQDNLVLVTGGNGFVGSHCVLQLLEAGYKVRATVRSLEKSEKILDMMRYAGLDAPEALSFIEADLTGDRNWDEAVAGCQYVLHVASPIFIGVPKHEDEMIRPAVDGTLRVIRAARDAGVKRVVITSSFAAVGYSQTDPQITLTEEQWTDPNAKNLSAYIKSKTLAERAAWDFVATEGRDLELTVLNPVGIYGPALNGDISSGFEILKRLLEGAMPAMPNFDIAIVDVRDLADLHLRAMTAEAAKGERFLALSGDLMSVPEMAALLRSHFGDRAVRVPTRILPDWLVRIGALFNETAKAVVPMLGRNRKASNQKVRDLLGWSPRPGKESVIASAESLFEFGHIKA